MYTGSSSQGHQRLSGVADRPIWFQSRVIVRSHKILFHSNFHFIQITDSFYRKMTEAKLPSSTSRATVNMVNITLYLLLASLLGMTLAVPTTTEGTVNTTSSTITSIGSTQDVLSTLESIDTSTGSTQSNLSTGIIASTTLNVTFPPVLEGFVSTEPPIKPKSYLLTVSNTSWRALGDLLQLDPVFVYVTLNFVDVTFDSDTAYLNDAPSVVDPYTWTWASGKIGYFLRSFPPNFFYFSFSTFSSNVYTITLNVSINTPEKFMKQNDSIKLRQVAESLTHIFQQVSERFNLTLDEFKVCQEFFDHKRHTGTALAWVLTLHVYMYQTALASIKVKCWSKDGIGRVEKKTEHSLWLTILYYTVIGIGALYFPYILLKLVIQKSPPIDDDYEDVKRIHKHSSLPLGLQYYLCIYGNEQRLLYILRLIALVALIFILAYLEHIILKFSDNRYTVRVNSAYRSVVDKDLYFLSICISVVVCVSVVVVFIWERFCRSHGENDDFCIETETNLFEIKNKGYPWDEIPEPSKELHVYDRFFHYMKFRMSMAVDKRVVWDQPLKNRTLQKYKFLIFLARMVILLPYSLSLFLIYCPSVYVLQWFWWYVWKIYLKIYWKIDRKIDREIDSRVHTAMLVLFFIIIFMIPSSFLVVTSYSHVVIGVASLVGNVVEYTFSGFLLNIQHLNPSFYITLTIARFALSAVKHFYDSYQKFFEIMVESAIKHDESVCPERKVTRFATISTHLFWHIIDEVKPVWTDLLYRLVQFLAVIFVTLSAYDILEEVQLLGGISQSTHAIISVAIPIIFPYLNPSFRDNEEKQRGNIEDALDRYVKKQGNKIKKIKRGEYQEYCQRCIKTMKENNWVGKGGQNQHEEEVVRLFDDINVFPLTSDK